MGFLGQSSTWDAQKPGPLEPPNDGPLLPVAQFRISHHLGSDIDLPVNDDQTRYVSFCPILVIKHRVGHTVGLNHEAMIAMINDELVTSLSHHWVTIFCHH